MLRIIKTSNRSKDSKDGDCVVNALSIAYDKSYEEVLKDFERYNEDGEEGNYQLRYNIAPLMAEYDYIDYLEDYLMDYPNMEKFCIEHPNGTYVVHISWGLDYNGHMTVVKNGDVYDYMAPKDTWRAKVIEAWRVK